MRRGTNSFIDLPTLKYVSSEDTVSCGLFWSIVPVKIVKTFGIEIEWNVFDAFCQIDFQKPIINTPVDNRFKRTIITMNHSHHYYYYHCTCINPIGLFGKTIITLYLTCLCSIRLKITINKQSNLDSKII